MTYCNYVYWCIQKMILTENFLIVYCYHTLKYDVIALEWKHFILMTFKCHYIIYRYVHITIWFIVSHFGRQVYSVENCPTNSMEHDNKAHANKNLNSWNGGMPKMYFFDGSFRLSNISLFLTTATYVGKVTSLFTNKFTDWKWIRNIQKKFRSIEITRMIWRW